MPSLLGTAVAANYGRMVAQDTYATGADFSSFGTRPMRLLKVVASGVTNGSFILQDGSTADADIRFRFCTKFSWLEATKQFVQPFSSCCSNFR